MNSFIWHFTRHWYTVGCSAFILSTAFKHSLLQRYLFFIYTRLQKNCNHMSTKKTFPFESLLDVMQILSCHSEQHYSKCFLCNPLPTITLNMSLIPFNWLFSLFVRFPSVPFKIHMELSTFQSWRRCVIFYEVWLSYFEGIKLCTYYFSLKHGTAKSAVYSLPVQWYAKL